MIAPEVSIIIPCYNAARFLAKTLDSVLTQRFDNFELIIINDGSTDGTADIIESYRPRFEGQLICESGPNRGVSATRNRGTALASGNYLQYLDADDLLRPHALQAKVAALQGSGNDIAYSDWQELTEAPSGQFVAGKSHTRRCEDVHPDPEIAIFTTFWAPPAALLYRREIVARVGGWNPSLAIVQDGRFLFDAVHCGGRLRHVPGIGADYRVTLGSLSRHDPADFMRESAEDAFQVEALWRREGELTEARKSALLRRFGSTTSLLYELDRPAFWRVYGRMQALEPKHIPKKTCTLTLTSRLIGYPGAEGLALCWRRLRKALKGRPA